jgi:hypothetical protein
MTRFLTEAATLTALREMLDETRTATLVVAFWGLGAVDSLGLDKEWDLLRIVCNLDSGACNPKEIKRLLEFPGVQVRNDWRLHGKVYWTPTKMLLGSSNASSNGLAVEGAALAGWAEANIETTDQEMLSSVANWCNERFDAGTEISEAKLILARQAWNARFKVSPLTGGLTTDLIEAVRRQPSHPVFETIKLIRWAKDISPEGVAFHASTLDSDKSLAGTEAYEGWGEDMSTGDWLLDFHIYDDVAEFTGYWNVVDVRGDIAFVLHHTEINIPTLGRLKLKSTDLKNLEGRVRELTGKRRGPTEIVVGIPQVATFLANTKLNKVPIASRKQFDEAMNAIYAQASAHGYHPTEFRSMVQKIGGLATAKQLINSARPSPGFLKLVEMNMPHLTVEALAVRPEWSSLFDARELQRAKLRLRQIGYK